ncbi:DUF1834 family protein [Methylophilus sp. YYY-1]|nr:DUF1834 family protein [Methylophilus sp. YYY-1]
MISQVETAIITEIKAAAGMAYLKTVDSYGGQFDEDLGEVIRSYPAVWVSYAGGAKPKPLGSEKYLVPATFVTFVAARNLRNEQSTRHGSPGEVGTYQLLSDVRTLLMRQDFGLAIEHLKPGAVRTLYNTRIRNAGLSVFSLEWSTAFVEKVPSKDEVDLLKIGLNYTLKPGDDIPDASDLLTLS